MGRRIARPLWLAVMERDDYQCMLRQAGCTGTATTADHIVPVSKGGIDSLDNLRAACRHCNSSRGNKTLTRVTYLAPEFI